MKLANPDKHPRLHLALPDGVSWPIRHLGPNLSECDVDANVSIQVRTLVVPTVEHMAWIEGIMLERAPPNTRLQPVTVEATTSTRGWPIVFAHYELHAPDGSLLEERAGAFYAIVHCRAEVVVRCRRGARWRDREAELKPYIVSAHVNWPEFEHDLVYTQLGFPT